MKKINKYIPMIIEIEPTNYCNLKCKMCHVRFMKDVKVDMLDIKHIKNLSESIKNSIFNIGAVFEPAIHKNFSQIIQLLSKNNRVIFTTNATNVDDKLLSILQISDNIYTIYLSIDSIVEKTYESIRVNGKFEQVSSNIKKIATITSKKKTNLIINMVLMKSNINELIDMIDYCEENGIDKLNLIFMVIRDISDMDLVNESLFPIRKDAYKALDVAAEYIMHNNLKVVLSCPYFNSQELRSQYPNNIIDNTLISDNKEAKYIKNIKNIPQVSMQEDMKIACSSPWTFSKILWNGAVEVCYKFNIGNLNDNTLINIFNSIKSNEVRNKIIQDSSICETCDYYKFCLSSNKIDLDNIENFFSKEILKVIDYTNLWSE